MNYYIQGDAAKADKIKAAFEKLGYDVTGFDMCNDNILFFTYKLQTGANVISTTNTHLYTANIIKTHPDYKELELPAEPKFKVGDKIQAKDSKMYVYTVLSVDLQNQKYIIEHDPKHLILFTKQDNFELVPKPHYDIANFYAGMPVLVRDENDGQWYYTTYSHCDSSRAYKFMTSACQSFIQCIPFNDETKHLLGTTDQCDEQYINW